MARILACFPMTPLMKQYWDIKALHEDKVLLFRMGDFFEMFFEDAKKAAPILGIALTQRNKKSADETPMCGVPHHSIGGPINKLLAAGVKVAICDQLEDPKFAKGIVKRGVTRVLTPGMVYDPEALNPKQACYMACYESKALALVDTSTGESFYFEDVECKEAERLLATLPVVELVLENAEAEISFKGLKSVFSFENEEGKLVNACARLKAYVESLQGSASSHRMILKFEKKSLRSRLDLTPTVTRHLEIFQSYKGDAEGSLLWAMDRTRTSTGARLLRQWVQFPLLDVAKINQRLDHLEEWRTNPSRLRIFRDLLGDMGDIERRLAKISQPQTHARDFLGLVASTDAGIKALRLIDVSLADQKFAPLEKFNLETSRTFVEEPPLSTTQGYMIQKGVSSSLDELIELSTNSQGLLQELENREKEQTGISSLKVRYNNVFGYYIEVTHVHAAKVPVSYMRKQTLTNAERFTTDELVELEKKVLSANVRRAELEKEIFEDLKRRLLALAPLFLELSQVIAEKDVVSSLAWLAIEKRYTRPQFVKEGLSLKASRHPVVEQTVKKSFVPNDIDLMRSGCLLLTGPNMAGKSTLMRQVALTVIMAQMGSYVPAESAKLPVFEHLFTRIGASDQLSEGLSTFMVEMTETADMLKSSGAKSLIILDEIGRGTSTFDGMALAQAIMEHILNTVKATTLFATHYHELTSLDEEFAQLRNGHMSVIEKNGEIQFLHTLTTGPATKSYGVQVGKLAGLPEAVTKRAQSLLKERENQSLHLKPQQAQMSFLEI
jgi:DNA mismatch repair protein MutS